MVKRTLNDPAVLSSAIDLCLESSTGVSTAPNAAQSVVSKLRDGQIEIMRLVAAGYTNAEIARERYIEEKSVAKAVTRLLEENKHPEHGYRACLGLLSLAKRYGKPRLEAGCTLALQIGACQYRHVRDILANNRDSHASAPQADWTSPDHAHVRGPNYYQ